jgi:hypothetical protein
MSVRDLWSYDASLALFLGAAVLFLSVAALGVYVYARAPPAQKRELDEKHWLGWTSVLFLFGSAGAILFVLMLMHGGDAVSG